MKKKVVFLVRDLNYGGAQRQLVTLVNQIDKQLFDVSLVYFYANGLLLKDLKDDTCQAICIKKNGRWDIFGFYFRLLQQLKILQPDILHGYLGESNLFSILLKPFFPFTRIIWGIRESNMPNNRFGAIGQILAQLEVMLSFFADLIIVNSHCGKDYYQSKGFSPQKMVVISNGIDTHRFQPDATAGAKVRSEWGITDDTILIGLVGRLDPMKDHPNFFRAAAVIAAERQDVRFVCIGVGGAEKYAAELQQLSEDLGIADRVIWAGGRSDMPAVFNALDICCSASAYGEGFPNVVGEAMACGTPSVVTDVGDAVWIVGDLGVFVPPQNPEALQLALNQSLRKLPLDRASSAEIRAHIVDRFSVEQLVLNTQAALLDR